MAIALEELEVGLMFWGDTEPLKMIRAVKSLGIRCGHLGFTGAVPLAGLGAVYKQALADPDAFPAGDLVLRKAAHCTEKELTQRAEAWRPWRAYAAVHLWRSQA